MQNELDLGVRLDRVRLMQIAISGESHAHFSRGPPSKSEVDNALEAKYPNDKFN